MTEGAEPTSGRDSFRKWAATRPPAIQAMCEKMPPWRLFRMEDTGQLVSVIGYFEDGTVRVHVHEDPRLIDLSGFEVFGVDPGKLSFSHDILEKPE